PEDEVTFSSPLKKDPFGAEQLLPAHAISKRNGISTVDGAVLGPVVIVTTASQSPAGEPTGCAAAGREAVSAAVSASAANARRAVIYKTPLSNTKPAKNQKAREASASRACTAESWFCRLVLSVRSEPLGLSGRAGDNSGRATRASAARAAHHYGLFSAPFAIVVKPDPRRGVPYQRARPDSRGSCGDDVRRGRPFGAAADAVRAAVQVGRRNHLDHGDRQGRGRSSRSGSAAGSLRRPRGWRAAAGDPVHQRARPDRPRPAARCQRQHVRQTHRRRPGGGRSVPVRSARSGGRVLRVRIQP